MEKIMAFRVLVFVFSMLNIGSYSREVCPRECTCDPGIKQVICHNQTSVPSGIPVDVELLDLFLNRITVLAPGMLNTLRRLEKLTLSWNHIEEIQQGTFTGLYYLTFLNFQRNRLHNIDVGVFSGCRYLQKLYFDKNFLTTIKANTFKELSRLTTLYLSSNSINTLEYGAFRGLYYLQSLHLEDNNIVHLPPAVFNHARRLDRLYLQRNKLINIGYDTFWGLSRLSKLDLSENSIDNIHPTVLNKLYYLEKLYLDKNKLKVLSRQVLQGLSRLSTLNLRYNNFQVIEAGAFDSLTSLYKLQMKAVKMDTLNGGLFKNLRKLYRLEILSCDIEKLTNNSLRGLQYLRYLWMDDNKLTNIEPGSFNGLKSVRSILFRRNKLKHLKPGVFVKLPKLVSLYFTSNQISNISVGAFQDLSSLIRLFLNKNLFKVLEPNVFLGLSKVYILSISDGQLEVIQPGAFKGLSTLQTLSLYNNTITALQPDTFKEVNKLTVLLLQQNNISVLGPNSFRGLENLQQLDLSDCNIKDILPGAFAGLNYYGVTLKLENNKLVDLRPGVFNGTSTIRSLYLSGNLIENLNSSWLQGLVTLQILMLKDNRIKTFNEESFKGLNVLHNLDLIGNQIRELKPGTLKHLPRLTYLFLDNNQLTTLSGIFNNSVELRMLTIYDNRIDKITRNSFKGLKKIVHIEVTKNIIRDIAVDSFKGLSELLTLKINENSFKEIKGGTFRDCQNLNTLYLFQNEIEILHPDSFKSLYQLTKLNISDNRISVLPEGIFSDLKNMNKLFLARNQISHFNASIFRNLKRLWILDLSGNKLKIIRSGPFAGLKLNQIMLADNQISHIENDAFNDSTGLFFLNLGRNRLSALPPVFLRHFKVLETLVLQDNQFSSIPEFPDKIHVSNFFFAGNKLKTIPSSKLKRSANLLLLLLDNNHLERIANHAFYGAFSLTTLTLSRNPIKVIEEEAFLSLPNLKLINLLNTQIIVPLDIWPIQVLGTYVIYQILDLETVFSISVTKSNVVESFRSLGYVCNDSDLVNPTICVPCDRGTYKSHKFQTCKLCPPGGFYQNEMGYTGARVYGLGCKQCPPGSYVKPERAPGKSQTDCQSCPEGTNLKAFAKFRACSCLSDYYRLDRFGPCVICTKGYVCSNETVDLDAGFYWVWKSSSSQMEYEAFKRDLNISSNKAVKREFKGVIPIAYACPTSHSCLGGIHSSCQTGYTGPLCAVCDTGYFISMAKCRRCPTLPWIVAQIVVAIFAMAILITVVWWEKKKEAKNSSRSLADIFLARLKIVIGFYQVSSSTFSAFSYIDWPAPILTMMTYAKMAQLNLLQILPLNCVNNSAKVDAYVRFLIAAITTLFVILMGMFFNSLVKCCIRQTGASSSTKKKRVLLYKEKLYRLMFLILFITFPSTCTQVMQMLPAACHKICSHDDENCNSYLKGDYSVQCNTSKHDIYGSLSTASLCYCIGFPLLLFLIMKYGQSNGKIVAEPPSSSRNTIMFNSIRFLYENYSSSCWFWEILELVRKVFFTSMLVLMDSESRVSLGLNAILSGLYSVIFALSKPIEDTFEYWLQLVSLLVTSVNFSVGMLLKIPVDEASSSVSGKFDSLVVTILLVAANVAVIVIIAVKYVTTLAKTLIQLKNEPQCNMTCCLEVFQLVSDAHGDVSGICSEPKMASGLIGSSEQQGVSNMPDDAALEFEDQERNGDEFEREEKHKSRLTDGK